MKLADEKCTMCGACISVCPKNAIDIENDALGFSYPKIDDSKCINCKKCINICPMLEGKVPQRSVDICYAMYSNDCEIRKASTSGGFCYTLGKYYLEKGYSVYSFLFDRNLDLVCKKISSLEDLARAQGSKYVEGKAYIVFDEIESDLKNGGVVLFMGTPCQVAGILSRFGSYKNLLTVSFICGGVPSTHLLKAYLQEKNFCLDEIENIRFRKCNEYGLWVNLKREATLHFKRNECQYLMGFDQKAFLRKSCYTCKFSRTERVGDITVGDFWGIKEAHTNIAASQFEHGISIVIPTTDAGEKIVELLRSEKGMYCEEHPFKDGIIDNYRLKEIIGERESRVKFEDLYSRLGLIKSINRLYGLRYLKMSLTTIVKKVLKIKGNELWR